MLYTTVYPGAVEQGSGRGYLLYQTTLHYANALAFWHEIGVRSTGDLHSVLFELKHTCITCMGTVVAVFKQQARGCEKEAGCNKARQKKGRVLFNLCISTIPLPSLQKPAPCSVYVKIAHTRR